MMFSHNYSPLNVIRKGFLGIFYLSLILLVSLMLYLYIKGDYRAIDFSAPLLLANIVMILIIHFLGQINLNNRPTRNSSNIRKRDVNCPYSANTSNFIDGEPVAIDDIEVI